MRVDLHPEARAEFRAAAIWYDEQESGLGNALIADVNLTLDRIAVNPHAYGQGPKPHSLLSGGRSSADSLTSSPMKKIGIEYWCLPSHTADVALCIG